MHPAGARLAVASKKKSGPDVREEWTPEDEDRREARRLAHVGAQPLLADDVQAQGLCGEVAKLLHALRADGELDGVRGRRHREADPVDL
eukprot:6280712-Heterocapsa_arctica.AAC.1